MEMQNDEIKTNINQDLSLIQSVKGLTFGTDAYLLSAFVKKAPLARAVDLGSGTGVIPMLCMANGKVAKYYAVEIQEKFAEIIEKNALINGFTDKIVPILADLRDVKSTTIGCEVDIVTANPPYMKLDSGKRNEHDEKFIARHEVFGDIGDFCACASRILKHGGKFYTVWRPDRLCDLIFALRQNKLEPKRITFVHATKDSEPSIVLIQSTKGASSGSIVTRPLILHDSKDDAKNSILSLDAQRIYDTCSFENFK